jgi:hypothetical protein
MSADTLTHLTAEEAIEHVTAAAFEVTDPEMSDYGRRIVHCFAGFMGADWDLDKVIDTLKTARDIAWLDHWAEHDLAVLTEDGRVRCFQVKRPEAAQAQQDGGQADA